MKIGVVTKKEYRNTGIETFESKLVPKLLEEPEFEPIYYEVSDSYPLSTTIENFLIGRKIKKQGDRYDKIFLTSQGKVQTNPADVDAEVIPYIHDILPVTTNFSGWFATPLAKRYTHFIEKCERVIASTDTTRQELQFRTEFNGKAPVVHQGIELPEIILPEKRKYDLAYVGSMIPRKDPEFLRETIRLAENAGYNCIAVNWRELDLPCKTRTDVSDRELAEILANSRFYIHPSKAEGFGRTPVEAQNAGAIPLARDLPINREVLGIAGESWVRISSPQDAVEELGKEKNYSEMRKTAMENSKRFTWEDTIQSVKNVLLGEKK